MKEVKLNTTGIKFTPSAFITFYEVNTNFTIDSEAELLAIDEVKRILNAYKPIIKGNKNEWSIGISTPLKDIQRRSRL
jgi:hypothetical protein